MSVQPFTDELVRVMHGNTVMSPHHCFVGGEWDHLQSLPRRTVRSLQGGGFLTAAGVRPDVAADWINQRVGGLSGTTCDAMRWYVTTCQGAAIERRHERWRRQYRNRDRRAAALGFGTYWYHRLYRAEFGTEALS